MSYRIINGKPYVVGNFPSAENKSISNKESIDKGNSSFREVLKEKCKRNNDFVLSNHAAERLKNINFSDKDFLKLSEGINLAKEKGCKNSVIVYKDIAFVTSIENKTVITAVEKDRSKENIFTNVDSVLFL